MDAWQAIVLGLVEGLTEYLPVSSTAHLLIAQRALGIPQGDAANAYAICIQAGAIVAVLGLYAGRVRRMALGLLGRDVDGRRLAWNVAVGFAPAAVVGLVADKWIERHLYGLWPVAAALLVGGLLVFPVEGLRRRRAGGGRGIDELTWRAALVIGLCQCAALWPGTSRSLATIVGGLLVGLRLRDAVEFSFLLGVVTLLAATGYKALDQGPAMLEAFGWSGLALGFVSAWVAAVVSVRWMIAYLGRHGLALFGVYRVAAAVALVLWLV
jgi:undecaprenyl-diphosphatase